MFSVATDWNPAQARLKEIIRKQEYFEEAIELTLHLHSLVHLSSTSGNDIITNDIITLEDEVWQGLDEKSFAMIPTPKGFSIAWNIWHITRIEDITMNILVTDSQQVLDDDWLKRLNVSVKDTGNAMSIEEIAALSNHLRMDELKSYRNEVALRIKSILKELSCTDMKRKVSPGSVQRILEEGGVTEQPDSKWLLDFWGKKDVAGIIMMPITRHQVGHLNDCLKIRNKLKIRKKYLQ